MATPKTYMSTLESFLLRFDPFGGDCSQENMFRSASDNIDENGQGMFKYSWVEDKKLNYIELVVD
jgi:hypothetical protein